MIGIYKIVSPIGRVYVGQSTNIEKRWNHYRSLDCKDQQKIYNSFVKYGVCSHIFLIIEECDVSDLNERERYWQEYYDVVKKGLNCKMVFTNEKSGFLCEETKKKISKANKGRSNRKNYNHSEETKRKISEANKGKKATGFLGNHSEETKRKISEANKGRIVSDEHKLKLSLAAIGRPSKLKGRIFTEEERKTMYSTRKKIKNICKLN